MVDTHHQSRSRPGLLTYRFELASASGAGATTASRRSLASRAIEMIPRLWCPFPPQIAFAACSLDWRQSPSKILSKVVWLYRVLIKTLFSAPPAGREIQTPSSARASADKRQRSISQTGNSLPLHTSTCVIEVVERVDWLSRRLGRNPAPQTHTHTHTQR